MKIYLSKNHDYILYDMLPFRERMKDIRKVVKNSKV